MINPSWRRFLHRKRFEVVFESKKWGFTIRNESGKPRRGLQIFDIRVDFSVPVQSRGRFLYM